MGEEKKALLLFQIGPVQEFIAQAAEASDLWAGSYLLSDLILAGIRKIPGYADALVFPNMRAGRGEGKEEGSIEEALGKKLIPTIPNRFLAFIPAGEEASRAIAGEVEAAVRGRLASRALALGIPGAAEQAGQFLSVTWAILREPSGRMDEDYRAIGKKLALRRNLRDFAPWREAPGLERRRKDFLSGKEAELDPKSHLGALNLIKRRLIAEHPEKAAELGRVVTDEDPYLAVIAMDGDHMGATLSSLRTEEGHRDFSAALAEFACSVEERLAPFSGKLIYAGGDDVLAVVPAKEAFHCAQALADGFSKAMGGVPGGQSGAGKVTASAGIAVGHVKAPLQDLVHQAQAAESRAKNKYDRNAMAVSVFKRSGETLEWGCKWNSKAFALYDELTRLCGRGEDAEKGKTVLSGRFPYKLAELLAPYGKLGEDMAEVVRNEAAHVREHSILPGRKKETAGFPEKTDAYLKECKEEGRMDDFLNLFLCETFINRPRDGKED